MVINISNDKRGVISFSSYDISLSFVSLSVAFLPLYQVMETERMIYLVTEYASGGEIFGKYLYCILSKAIEHTLANPK